MKYNNQAIIDRFESEENLKFLFFWGHTEKDQVTKACFSQWYEMPFTVNGMEFKTAEHWMMAEKARLFNDQEKYEQIVASKKPGEAKQLGREVRGFDPQRWEENRFDIVVRGNLHKFSQNDALAEFLKNTKERILVEASPVDPIWGIGMAQDHEDVQNPHQWKGLNLLGYALMEVRDMLNKK